MTGLPHLLPPLLIFLLVVGSIYAGLATPTEAASLGVLGALVIAAATGSVSRAMLAAAFRGTMRTTGMLMLIVSAAYFLNFVFGNIGLTRNVVAFFQELALGPYETLAIIIVFYLILGLFMETLSLMVATVPIFTPIVVAMGFDPVWFGVLVIMLIETAMITPPVGINLFVIQGVREDGRLAEVVRGVLPFLAALLVGIALLVAVPGLALWLPGWLG